MFVMYVRIDERSIKEAAYILRAVPRAVPHVLCRAINRAVDMSATDLKRRIGEQLAIKKGEIAKGISKKKATYTNLTGFLGAKPYKPGLLEFPGTRQTKRGVSYRISRTAGRKFIEHGFIATMPSGHRGVFLRARYAKEAGFEYKQMKYKKKEAIYERRGPSIWWIVIDTPGLLDTVIDSANKRLGKLIHDQIGVEFEKWPYYERWASAKGQLSR